MAKPKMELSEDERAALVLEYDIVMREPPEWGGGWPVLWESEDAFIRARAKAMLPPKAELLREFFREHDSVVRSASLDQPGRPALWESEDTFIKYSGFSYAEMKWWFCGPSEMKEPPWSWTPLEGAVEAPFARAIRWAYHHGYPRPFETDAEDLAADLLNLEEVRMRVMGNDQPTPTSDEVESMVRQAYVAGRVDERRAAAQRAAAQSKQGAPPKGIPREAQGGRDIRRAVLIAFLRKRGIPVSHPEGGDWRSACDAVALAEAVREMVGETPPSDLESRVPMFYGETAISLLAHTPNVQASKVIADEAWDAAERIGEGLANAGEAAGLWETEQKELGWIARPDTPGTGYESVRKNWQRFKSVIDDIETAPSWHPSLLPRPARRG